MGKPVTQSEMLLFLKKLSCEARIDGQGFAASSYLTNNGVLAREAINMIHRLENPEAVEVGRLLRSIKTLMLRFHTDGRSSWLQTVELLEAKLEQATRYF